MSEETLEYIHRNGWTFLYEAQRSGQEAREDWATDSYRRGEAGETVDRGEYQYGRALVAKRRLDSLATEMLGDPIASVRDKIMAGIYLNSSQSEPAFGM